MEDWGLRIGDWGSGVGNWRLGIEDRGSRIGDRGFRRREEKSGFYFISLTTIPLFLNPFMFYGCDPFIFTPFDEFLFCYSCN